MRTRVGTEGKVESTDTDSVSRVERMLEDTAVLIGQRALDEDCSYLETACREITDISEYQVDLTSLAGKVDEMVLNLYNASVEQLRELDGDAWTERRLEKGVEGNVSMNTDNGPTMPVRVRRDEETRLEAHQTDSSSYDVKEARSKLRDLKGRAYRFHEYVERFSKLESTDVDPHDIESCPKNWE